MNVGDIYVGSDLIPAVTLQGECKMVSDVDVINQDIRLRLQLPVGCLFYDEEFGSYLYLFINEENTAINRQALIAEIETRIEMDSRVIPLSVTATLISWDEDGITAQAQYSLYETETEQFLHISIGDDYVTVVEDVNTD
ncbi:MAG: baseplate assembly protein [Deferribacterales bacterium]